MPRNAYSDPKRTRNAYSDPNGANGGRLLRLNTVSTNSPKLSKVIPLLDTRKSGSLPAPPTSYRAPSGELLDAGGRALRDLRISVTDRCNFRCVYCMPKEVFDSSYQFLPHGDLLTFEEITRVAQ